MCQKSELMVPLRRISPKAGLIHTNRMVISIVSQMIGIMIRQNGTTVAATAMAPGQVIRRTACQPVKAMTT
jgi:hypothetical protein